MYKPTTAMKSDNVSITSPPFEEIPFSGFLCKQSSQYSEYRATAYRVMKVNGYE